MPTELPTTDDLVTAVTTALADWRTVDKLLPPALQRLLLVRQQLQDQDEPIASVWRMVINKVLFAAMERLAEFNPTGAEILRLRYADDWQLGEITPRLGLDRHQIRRQEKKAVQELVHILWEQEKAARGQRAVQLLQGLSKPPTYDRLFGAADVVTQLEEALLAKDRAWLVAVTGIGGIGKTAVADQAIRRTARSLHFEAITAQYLESGNVPLDKLLRTLAAKVGLPVESGMNEQAIFSELGRTFKARPWLIWLDGFETDISHLDEGLGQLANPSKFILTSRHRPAASDAFFVKPLTPLAFTAAADLLRDHARRTGRSEMAAASDEQIKTIYNKVGGNPLALKLVVGWSDKHTIPTILHDLTELKIEPKIEDLYRHIYMKAWRALSQPAQTVLQAMPMIPASGQAELEDIVGFCQYAGLDLRAVSAALDDLIERSLVESHGSPWEAKKLYGIHSLTRSFLQTAIIHYPNDSL